VGERREPKSADERETTGAGALDPITGLGRGAAALVIGKSAGERESVARAVHRSYRGADGPFLRVQCAQEESLLKQALEGWLAGSAGESSPRLLTRLESGSLFLDGIEALGPETQQLLSAFFARIDEEAEGTPWKGQLIAGTEGLLRQAVMAGRFDVELANRLERVRIVLDPDQAGSEV